MHISFSDLNKEDVKELSAFLKKGLGAPGASAFADEDILLWKYFSRDDEDKPRSIIARNAAGEIVAHCGATYAKFRIPGNQNKVVRGVFPVDWLSFQVGAGLKILKIAALGCDLIYSIGGTNDARKGLTVMKCKKKADLQWNRKFLTRSHAYQQAFQSADHMARKYARAIRNLAQYRSLPAGQTEITLERKQAFIEDDFKISFLTDHVQTIRTTHKINHMLLRPEKNISGWTILYKQVPVGYALLSKTTTPGPVSGKIVDYQFHPDYYFLHSSIITTLLHKLKELGAGTAFLLTSTTFQSEPVHENAFRGWGFNALMMSGDCFPEGYKFYLNALEADLGYE